MKNRLWKRIVSAAVVFAMLPSFALAASNDLASAADRSNLLSHGSARTVTASSSGAAVTASLNAPSEGEGTVTVLVESDSGIRYILGSGSGSTVSATYQENGEDTFTMMAARGAIDPGSLRISTSASRSGSSYRVTYSASLSMSSDLALLASENKDNAEALNAFRFTCVLEDGLLAQLSSVSAGDVSISGNNLFDVVSASTTDRGIQVVYRLDSSVVDSWGEATVAEVRSQLQRSMSISYTGTATISQMDDAQNSSGDIYTYGALTITYNGGAAIPSLGGATQLVVPAAMARMSISTSGSGGSSGGSSSGSTTTETVENPDGSTTTTVTRPNGTVTETTTWPDGSTTEVVTQTDGSSTTTVEQADGSSSVTTVDRNGQAETTVEVPAAVVNEAAANDEAVSLPMPSVTDVEVDTEDAHRVTVDLSGASQVTVEIPVENPTPGTVAILVNPDGSEEVLRTCVTTDTSVLATLNSGDTVKIVDNSIDFVDVPGTHWASDYIDFATSRGLFSGTSANTFSPDLAMTRGMIVTVLSRFDNVEPTGGSVWYEAGRNWAMANGISDGSGMENVITREQLALMLYRYAGSPAVSGNLNAYTDGSTVSSWAEVGMIWAVQNGLISGVGDGRLDPQGSATRAQVATILRQYIVNVLN